MSWLSKDWDEVFLAGKLGKEGTEFRPREQHTKRLEIQEHCNGKRTRNREAGDGTGRRKAQLYRALGSVLTHLTGAVD